MEHATETLLFIVSQCEKKESERQLFLAVEKEIYNEFFLNADVLELVESEDLNIVVFDELKEVIVRCIN